METKRFEHRHLDVACELGGADAEARGQEWRRLRQRVGLGAELIPDGARLWFRAQAQADVEELVRREVECCGFLDFELTAERTRVRLDITSPAHGAGTVIACLAGLDGDRAQPSC